VLTDEQHLIEKLRRIEALFARPGTDGERIAAGRARDRILQRLRETPAKPAAQEEILIEFRFSLADPWSQRLLNALLRHHGVSPYRRRGQRRNVITARMSRRFVDEVLWPQFREFERELRDYFDSSTERIIDQALASSPVSAKKSR
jgi:hypothetical protein